MPAQLDTLRTVASDPASTTGQIVDALTACAALPDFPVGSFRPALSATGWSDIRTNTLRACDNYAKIHAHGEASRAKAEREHKRRAALTAFWTARGVDGRDVSAATELVDAIGWEFDKPNTSVANGGVSCSLTTGATWSRRAATLTEAAAATKPIANTNVTVGNLRRLSTLGIVEHRSQRLYFTSTIVDALREAGFIDADGNAVPA